MTTPYSSAARVEEVAAFLCRYRDDLDEWHVNDGHRDRARILLAKVDEVDARERARFVELASRPLPTPSWAAAARAFLPDTTAGPGVGNDVHGER